MLQDSVSGQRDETPPATPNPSIQQFTITRSQTDSNISYESESTIEATGSSYYITPDGEISIEVVLKVIYFSLTMLFHNIPFVKISLLFFGAYFVIYSIITLSVIIVRTR